MGTRNIPVAEAGPRVADVMLRAPHTVAPDTTVAAARAVFERSRVRLLLVAQDDRFVGAVAREHVAGVDGTVRLGEIAVEPELVRPEDPVDRVVGLLAAGSSDRLPVVTGSGALVGLVCFSRRHGHFCVDG